MKSENVWISRAMQDSTPMKSFTCDELEGSKEELDTVLNAMRRNTKGEPLPAHRFPTRIRAEFKGQHFKKLPDICMAAGFWLVSSACANIMREFDLGRFSLYPTEVFQFNDTTPVEGKYFYLNFGETKQAFLPDETPNVHVHSASPNLEPTGYWDLR